MKSFKDDYKITTVQVVTTREGKSPVLTDTTLDVSTYRYEIFSYDQVTDTVASLNITGGTPGETFYILVKSNGDHVPWGANIEWPSDMPPMYSTSGKYDLYHFVCITSTKYLGNYVYNYSV